MNSLRRLFALLLIVSFVPLVAQAQTADHAADKAERAHRKAVVKSRVHKVRRGTKKAYHKVVSTALSPVDKAVAKHKQHERAEGETH